MTADPEFHRAIEWQVVRRDELSPELVAEVLALYERSFDGWPQWSLPGTTAHDHLMWKTSDPHTDLAMFGGRLDGRLVHAATLRGANLRLRGENVRQVRFTDTSVDPDVRGRGLAGVAMKVVREGHLLPRAVRIGEPQHDFIRSWYGGRNRSLGNRVFLHVRILDAVRCVPHVGSLAGRRLLRLPGAAVLRVARDWSRFRARRSAHDPDPGVEPLERFDRSVVELRDAVIGDFDLIHERDAAYLNWRFQDVRAGDFRVRGVRRSGALLGYVVTCVRGDLGYIADLLVRPGEPSVAAALVADSVVRLTEAGAAGIACWMPRRHPYRWVLSRQGLIGVRDVGISYRPEDWPAERLGFLDSASVRVHYAIGDTDLV